MNKTIELRYYQVRWKLTNIRHLCTSSKSRRGLEDKVTRHKDNKTNKDSPGATIPGQWRKSYFRCQMVEKQSWL